MNDNQKKAAVIGGGAIAVGYYVLSQKGKDGGGGGMGDIIGKAGEGLSLPFGGGDSGAAPEDTISDILSNLPAVPMFTGGGGMGGGGMPMGGLPMGGGGMPMGVDSMGLPVTVGTKKGSGWSIPSLSGIVETTAKVGTYSVMKPTQILGGTAARAEASAETIIFNKKQLETHRAAQRRRVTRYPRTSHAISMLTGGTTAHAPVTKKQEAARRKHPAIYHTWKSLFGWLGA